MTRILLVGGGSAGHIAPLVAVAEAIEAIEPDARMLFVCSNRPTDGAFLTMEKRDYRSLPLPRRSLGLPFTFVRAFSRSLRIVRDHQPDVVFSKGGSVSVPLCLAARMHRIPIVLHESDAVMGWANRLVSRIADAVLLGTDIGNPVRSRITKGSKEEGLRITGFDGTHPVILVMGGSQGARAINETVVSHLSELMTMANVIHLTGPGKNTAKNKPGYYATEFGSDVLPHLYAATDLAVSRAGAGSIAELAVCGIPAILVPIRGLAGDHQVHNADKAQATGGTIVLPQELLEHLPARIHSLLDDLGALQTMRDRARYAAKPEAARLIAETVLQSVARKRAAA